MNITTTGIGKTRLGMFVRVFAVGQPNSVNMTCVIGWKSRSDETVWDGVGLCQPNGYYFAKNEEKGQEESCLDIVEFTPDQKPQELIPESILKNLGDRVDSLATRVWSVEEVLRNRGEIL